MYPASKKELSALICLRNCGTMWNHSEPKWVPCSSNKQLVINSFLEVPYILLALMARTAWTWNKSKSLSAPSQLWRLNDEMKLVNQRGSWLFEDISWIIPNEINNGKPWYTAFTNCTYYYTESSHNAIFGTWKSH